jgi:hypothetical protein
VLLTVTAATAVVTIRSISDDLALRDRGIKVEAVVLGGTVRPVAQRPRWVDIDDTRLTVQFETRDGEQVRTNLLTTRREVGTRVELLYDPGDPRRTRAVHGPHLPWRWPLLWLGDAFVATACLAVDLVTGWPHSRRP